MTRSPFNGYNFAETTDIMRANGRQAMRDVLDSDAVRESIRGVAARASKCVLEQLFAPSTTPGKGVPSQTK